MKRDPLRPGDLYGLLAQFDDPEHLIAAAGRTYGAGYRHLDAYSPFPIEELSEAIGYSHTRLPLLVLIGGIAGALGGYALQYWISAVAYPLNVGGRPLNSWPAFIPVTFECAILAAALTAVISMFAMGGFPQPYHPLFNVAAFAPATRDRFFLCIESRDPRFNRELTAAFLQTLEPRQIFEVPA